MNVCEGKAACNSFIGTIVVRSTFGKAIGGDILNDKKTWLLIMALKEDETGTVRSLIGNNENPEEKIRRVREVYDRLGLPDRIHELIRAYIDTAISCLDQLPIMPDARAFFIELALKSATRNK